MISRHWKGTVNPGVADAYVQHLRSETLPKLAALPGFVSVTIMRRAMNEGIEFQVVTVWESLSAIHGFAGDDAEAAVVPAAAQEMMSAFDRRAIHYEVVEQRARSLPT